MATIKPHHPSSVALADGSAVKLQAHSVACPSDKTYRMERRGVLEFALTPRPFPTRGLLLDRNSTTAWRPIGDILFVPRQVPFRVSVPTGRYETLTCYYTGSTLDEAGCPSDWSDSALRAGLSVHNPGIRSSLLLLLNELLDPGFGSAAYVEATTTLLLCQVLRHLISTGNRDVVHQGGLAPWRERIVTDRVRAADLPMPTVSELANLCNLTPRHFMRAFRTETGRTVGDYIREASLARAKSKLLEDAAPIKQIAIDLGFATTAGFSAAFRRDVGMSPREFRGSRGGTLLQS